MVSDADIAHERMDGVVPAEKRVQPRFKNVPSAVSPRRKLAAEHVAFLEDRGRPAGIGQIFCGGEPCRAAADDKGIVAVTRSTRNFGFGREEQN
jgi:hypothetical protein